MSAERRGKGLGMGLQALLGEAAPRAKQPADEPAGEGGVREIEVARIRPNPDQPRSQFGDEGLDELAASIAERGVLQPILVRPDATTALVAVFLGALAPVVVGQLALRGHHTAARGERQDVGGLWREVRQGVQVLATHLSQRSVDYRDADYTRPTCVLLGAEKWGVGDEAAGVADGNIIIPMFGMV